MKLYIPTTSLNFNNILSTESISPKGFYANRGFGYSRWFSIPENNLQGAILLYESPAQIVREKSDIEDHPLLIQVDTDENFPVLKDGIRYSRHTIYLNPWNTQFIFQEEKDKTIALSLSDSSLETKMLRLYKRKIVVQQASGTFPSLEDVEDIPIDATYLENDLNVNKMKGLLYGYYIGASLSASKEDVEQLNTLRDIQNIFAAIVSSFDRTPTADQMNRLESLFGSFAKMEPLYQDLLREICSEQLTDKVISILNKYGITVFRSNWKQIVSELQYDTAETNYAISWIKSEIAKQHQNISKHKQLLRVDAEELISVEGKLSKISYISDIYENKLYVSWINDVLIQSKYNGKVSSMKEDLADTLTKSAISTMGDKWNDSSIRTFLNQLRKHVRGEEFTQPWTNGILSSIAAVITKGDDWEPMLNFMQAKGMTDYRLAFSFYGILNGFANLTRDFTDLLLNQDNGYVSEVYREFYGQLHGVTIQTIKVPTQSVSPAQQISEGDNKTNSPLDSFVGRIDKAQLDANSKENEIWKFFNSLKNIKKKDLLAEGLRLCLERNKNMTDMSHFLIDLNDFDEYGWSKSNKPWKQMQEHFCPNYNDKVGQKRKAPKKTKNSSPSLFDMAKDGLETAIQAVKDVLAPTEENPKVQQQPPISQPVIPIEPSNQLLINDKNIFNFLHTLSYLQGKYLKKFEKDIYSLQKGYQPGGKYAAGGEKQSDPSNKQVIKHLGNYIKYGGHSPELAKLVMKFQEDLTKRYNVQ